MAVVQRHPDKAGGVARHPDVPEVLSTDRSGGTELAQLSDGCAMTDSQQGVLPPARTNGSAAVGRDPANIAQEQK